ncbi:MAG: Gfo/Idh/MocA family oxidoreductase [Verrucomicrobiota bacterium]
MRKIRFGIIGCGQITRIGHIPNLLRTESAEIVALNDVDRGALEKAVELVNCADKFTDFSEMLSKGGADAIIIASPNWLHYEQAVAALEAGKHVFCEKPPGITLEQGEGIRSAWRKSGKVLQIGHELRHAKVFESAKEKIREGLIGNIKMIRYSEFRKPLLPGWRQTGATGGVMLEKNSHFFDLFNWYADSRPIRVFSSAANDANKDSPLIDNCFVTVEYQNGIRACLTMCLFAEQGGENAMEIVGDGGLLRIKDEVLEIFIRASRKKLTFDCSLEQKEGMHMGCRRQFEHFINCIRVATTPLNNIDSAIDTLKLSLAAEKSANDKSIVNIN